MNFRDHFSGVAPAYAAFRPGYPASLFDWLASEASGNGLVWDCACGSGQASAALAGRFAGVVATDASITQLGLAQEINGVVFAAAAAERPPLRDQSVDLVTVASALHWFSGESFFAEVRRVLAPRGLFAAWTYGLPSVEDGPVGEAINRFGTETLGDFWPPEVRHVLSGYAEIEIPLGEIGVPDFEMVVRWTLPELLGFIRSWSGVAAYREELGEDPVELLSEELASLWTDTEVARRVSWSLAVRTARV